MLGNCALEGLSNSDESPYEISEPGFITCVYAGEGQICSVKIAGSKIVDSECLLIKLANQADIN